MNDDPTTSQEYYGEDDEQQWPRRDQLQFRQWAQVYGDYMETELDLENYLACFAELGVPAEYVDFNDAELRKAHVLYKEEEDFVQLSNGAADKDPYDELVEMYNAEPLPIVEPKEEIKIEEDEYGMNVNVMRDSWSDDASVSSKRRRSIRRPADFEFYPEEDEENDFSSDQSEIEESPSTSESEDDQPKRRSRKRQASSGLNGFKPQTKARKYKLLPEVVKSEPVYKLKRARNNDAVRKSRNKAKEIQKKRDDEFERMKGRIMELERLLEEERAARRRLEERLS